MAYSNRYFHMLVGWSEDKSRYVDLTSRGPEYGDVGEVFDNMIQMTVFGPIYGTANYGEIGIWLTEKQQDDLIAGILERRGIHPANSKPAIEDMLHTHYPIHADGEVQSVIHPAKFKSYSLTKYSLLVNIQGVVS